MSGAQSPEDEAARRERIREMFGSISPRYDLLNYLLSFGQDRRWRRIAIRMLDLQPGEVLVDVACGTGDVALTAVKRQPALGAVYALDFSEPMLGLLPEKVRRSKVKVPIVPAVADAVALPLADGCADALTIAFGIRNVVDVPRALAEMRRVLKPGGRLMILEFAEPRGRIFGPLFRWYFTHMLPRLGGLISGNRAAYDYLPRSVGEFFTPEAMIDLIRKAGFNILGHRKLNFGAVRAYLGGSGDG